jgi:hypothetical protein
MLELACRPSSRSSSGGSAPASCCCSTACRAPPSAGATWLSTLLAGRLRRPGAHRTRRPRGRRLLRLHLRAAGVGLARAELPHRLGHRAAEAGPARRARRLAALRAGGARDPVARAGDPGLGAAVVAITWGEPNQVGTQTFLVLWVMRTSAKLNVFLACATSARNSCRRTWPTWQSFFRRRPMNLLFPLSVLGASVVRR